MTPAEEVSICWYGAMRRAGKVAISPMETELRAYMLAWGKAYAHPESMTLRGIRADYHASTWRLFASAHPEMPLSHAQVRLLTELDPRTAGIHPAHPKWATIWPEYPIAPQPTEVTPTGVAVIGSVPNSYGVPGSDLDIVYWGMAEKEAVAVVRRSGLLADAALAALPRSYLPAPTPGKFYAADPTDRAVHLRGGGASPYLLELPSSVIRRAIRGNLPAKQYLNVSDPTFEDLRRFAEKRGIMVPEMCGKDGVLEFVPGLNGKPGRINFEPSRPEQASYQPLVGTQCSTCGQYTLDPYCCLRRGVQS